MSNDIRQRLNEVIESTLGRLKSASDLAELNEIRVEALGKKGPLKMLMKGMKDLAPEERPAFGQMVNEAQQTIEKKMEEIKSRLEQSAMEARLKREVIDVTLPAKRAQIGHRHPNAIVLDEVRRRV